MEDIVALFNASGNVINILEVKEVIIFITLNPAFVTD